MADARTRSLNETPSHVLQNELPFAGRAKTVKFCRINDLDCSGETAHLALGFCQEVSQVAGKQDLSRYTANHQDELGDAVPYHALTEAEEQRQTAQVYRRPPEVEKQPLGSLEREAPVNGPITKATSLIEVAIDGQPNSAPGDQRRFYR